jgi:hypothetical protein
MNLDKILEDYANEINGQVIPYDDDHSVIVVPVKNGRFQRVVGWVVRTGKYKYLEFNSKVCDFNYQIDLKHLLELSNKYIFSRIVIKDGYIQVASSIVVEHATEQLIKDMIIEVAQIADNLEQLLSIGDQF